MTRKPSSPLTERQKQASYRAAGRGYAKLFDKPVHPMDMEAPDRSVRFLTKVVPINPEALRPVRLEAIVKKECLAMLYKHPKIVTVGKFNNGGNYFGKQFVRYNQIRGDNHEDIRMVDCECKMVNGGTLAIDFKRSDWTPPDWERLRLKELRDGTKGFLTKSEEKEVAQKRYLDKINSLPNGIGIFATDVQTVIDKLEGV